MFTIDRPWALWRRVVYGIGFCVVSVIVSSGVYRLWLYESPTCFDNKQNGLEVGVDCGGGCVRICSSVVNAPQVLWSRAFRATEGYYNVVAYIENRNQHAGTPSLKYTVSLYDKDGLITKKDGEAVLPPDSVYPVFEGRVSTGNRIPTQAFIELASDPVWHPAEVGVEQFTVERRELVDADSKPKLSATLKNNFLSEARDVEIVATIFDTQGTALTSSRTVVPYFSGRSTEEVMFTWQEPIAKTLKSCEVPTDVVLAIDLSGSMNDDGGKPPEPVASVLAAAESFVSRLKKHDQVSIVTYATDAALVEALSGEHDRIRSVVKSLTIDPKSEKGSTNTGDAIVRAMEELSSVRHNSDARKILVLLTDGLANAPGETPEDYALAAATQLKARGADIYTIGLGAKVNQAFLKRIASDEKHARIAGDAKSVDGIYREVTSSMCEDGAAVIEIIPKTETNFAPLR